MPPISVAAALAAALAAAGCHHRAPAAAGPASACEAEVTRGGPAGELHGSWRARWQALRGELDEVAPADEAAAEVALCGDGGCAGDGPWLLAHVWEDSTVVDRQDLLIRTASGELRVHAELGSGMAGRCPFSDDVTIAGAGAVIHVVVSRALDDMVDVHVDEDGGLHACAEGEADCQVACFASAVSTTDLFFDPATGARLLAVERQAHLPDGAPFGLTEDFAFRETLAVGADHRVALRGPGCALDLTVPAPAPAP